MRSVTVLSAFLLSSGFVVVPSGARLQGPAPVVYRREPGDTLRFREVTDAAVTLGAPQGTFLVTSLHDGIVALTFGRGDSAFAWYEALSLADEGPQGRRAAETTSVLRQLFVLRIDPRGGVRTVRTPKFPPAVTELTDLTRQFHDFFPLLPPGGDLTVGRTWVDTVFQRDSSPNGQTVESRRIVGYRALRDTVVAGTQARIVSMRQQVRLRVAGPVPGQPMTARSELAGVDSGVFVFAPALGRMLRRSREARLVGTLTYEGGPQPVTLSQRYGYTSTIEALP